MGYRELLEIYNRRMKIGSVSKELGVPVPTVRRWTIEFANCLTKEAQGVNGSPREFSIRDVRLLKRAKELLGLPEATYKEVRLKLQDEGICSVNEKEDEAPIIQEPDVNERDAVDRYILKVFGEAIKPYQERIDALRGEVDDLKRKLATVEESQADGSDRQGSKRKSWRFTLW